MNTTILAQLVFWGCLAAVAVVLFVNPWLTRLIGAFHRPAQDSQASTESVPRKSYSVVTVCHNAGPIISDKVENTLSLRDGGHEVEQIVYADGVMDGIDELREQYRGKPVRFYESGERLGKNAVLNLAVSKANHDILLFSDTDSRVFADALLLFDRWFADTRVGGVSGQHYVGADTVETSYAQKQYVSFSSSIHTCESWFGSATACNGKLHAIRRELVEPIPDAVTDDLYKSLTVVRRGYLFRYDARIGTAVRMPSLSIAHEIARRRRIVCRSLRGMYRQRRVFNVFRYGSYSIRLFVNKVLRRVLPFLLLGLVCSSIALMDAHLFYLGALLAQAALVLAAVPGLLLPSLVNRIPFAGKRLMTLTYMMAGFYGSLLGCIDLACNKRYVTWSTVQTAHGDAQKRLAASSVR